MPSRPARPSYRIDATDVATLLALTRGGTLATASERLGVDPSTVFRTLQRIERGVGRRLFERGRAGYAPTELASELAAHGERIEASIEAARSALQQRPDEVAGHVRITTTDAVLHGLVAPALASLVARHPALGIELAAANEPASLTRRDADIAVRATRRPPTHLIGRRLGPIRVALYAGRASRVRHRDVEAGRVRWVAPDDALPEHPSVLWRRRHHPGVVPSFRVDSVLAVAKLVELGLGVGIVPMFVARDRPDLRALTGPLDDAETELWLLAHPESRHLRRVSVAYAHLAESIRPED